MQSKLKITKVPMKMELDGVILKGELEYTAKEISVRLIEPFSGSFSYRLQYAAPVKYVFEKSKKNDIKELEVKNYSYEKLKSIYFKRLNA